MPRNRKNHFFNLSPQQELQIVQLVDEVYSLSNVDEAVNLIKQQTIFENNRGIEVILLKLSDKYRDQYHDTGDIKYLFKAKKVGEILFREFPTYATGIENYVRSLEDLGEYERGIKIIENNLDFRNRVRGDIWYTYCRLLKSNNQLQEAIKEFKALSQKFPTNNSILFYYSQTLIEVKNYDETEIVLKRLLQCTPNHWKALLSLAYITQRGFGDNPSAIQILFNCLDVIDENIPNIAKATDKAKVYNQLGMNFEYSDIKKAIYYYWHAVQLDPNSTAKSALVKLNAAIDPKWELTSKKRAIEYYEDLRHAKPGRFADNHGHSKENQPNVQLTQPATPVQHSNKNFSTQTPASELTASSQVTCSKRQIRQTYLDKLTEIHSLRNQYQNDNSFNSWFEITFIKLKDGSTGKFVLAQRISENGNYVTAKNYLEEILTAVNAKIASKKKNKHKNKKLKHELIPTEKINTEISSASPTTTTVSETVSLPLLDSTPTLAKTSETNGKSSFSHMRSFLALFSDCCPTFFTRHIREEDNEMDKINPLKLTDKEISYKKL